MTDKAQTSPVSAHERWKIADGKRITGETLIFDGTFIVAMVTRREDAEAILAALQRPGFAQCLDLWRTDMQNAPKDRPFLVYWRRSKIYGVLEWNQDHWEDQDGAEVMAFSDWCEFTGPDTSTVLTSGEDK